MTAGPFTRDKGEAMGVLVAYASRHGSTAGIAERLAERLITNGYPAQARRAEDVDSLAQHDAVILGGATYMFHWLKPAVKFADHFRDELARRPVWLFSSGPLGTETVDEHGDDILTTSDPREFDRLVKLLRPRGTHVFFGAYDPEAAPIGMAERFVKHMPAAREALPVGDFRDWPAVDAWADQITQELRTLQGTPDDRDR
jgi:menaquinone-dependent protoporphyrinogen oxidase